MAIYVGKARSRGLAVPSSSALEMSLMNKPVIYAGLSAIKLQVLSKGRTKEESAAAVGSILTLECSLTSLQLVLLPSTLPWRSARLCRDGRSDAQHDRLRKYSNLMRRPKRKSFRSRTPLEPN